MHQRSNNVDTEGLQAHIERRLANLHDDGIRHGYTPSMQYEIIVLMLARSAVKEADEYEE